MQIVEAVKEAARVALQQWHREAHRTERAQQGSAAARDWPRALRGRSRRCRGCCTPASCAARTRTRGSLSVDGEAAAELPGVHGCPDAGRCEARCRVLSSRGAMRRACACPFRSTPRPSTRCATSASRWRWSRPTRRARAEDALELIEVDYEPLPAIATTDDGRRDPAAPLIYEELGSNVAWQGHVVVRRRRRARSRAPTASSARHLKIHRYSSTPLEPFACLAEHTPERLTIWCNSQSPEVDLRGDHRGARASMHVRVIVPDIGGGFGQKIHLIRKYAVLTALMAVKTGRPVKWIEDRSEHMMAGGHSCEQEFDVEAAVKADGEVLGLKIRDTDDVGGSISTLTIHFTNKLNNLFNTYKVKHLRLEGRSVLTNKCPVVPEPRHRQAGHVLRLGAHDGPHRPGARRSIPLAVRRRNLIGANEFPYTTPNGNIHGSGDYQTLLDKVAGERRLRRRSTQADGGASVGANGAGGASHRHRRRHRRRARRPERRPRHGDLSAVEADAGRRRRRGRHGQAREERLGRVHARLAELRPVARNDGVPDRRRRPRRRARADRDRRRRSTRRARRGACRPPTAATTSISTTSAPCTARRRGFGRRCSRWPRTC